MDLTVREALLAPLDVPLPALDLVLPRQDPLLGLRDTPALLGDRALDLCAQADGFLAGLDLRLATDRLGFAASLRDARSREQARGDDNDEHRRTRTVISTAAMTSMSAPVQARHAL